MNIETKILFFYLGLDDSEKSKFKNLLNDKARNILIHTDIHSITNYINNIIYRNYDEDMKSNMQYIPNEISRNKSFHGTLELERDSAMMQIVRKIEETTSSNLSLAKTIESLTGIKITRKEKRSKSELRGILIDGLMYSPKPQLLKIKDELIKKIQKTQVTPEGESNLNKWFSIILENKE